MAKRLNRHVCALVKIMGSLLAVCGWLVYLQRDDRGLLLFFICLLQFFPSWGPPLLPPSQLISITLLNIQSLHTALQTIVKSQSVFYSCLCCCGSSNQQQKRSYIMQRAEVRPGVKATETKAWLTGFCHSRLTHHPHIVGLSEDYTKHIWIGCIPRILHSLQLNTF